MTEQSIGEAALSLEIGPLRVSWKRRLWLSAPAHLLCSLGLGFLLVVVWATIHDWKRPSYESETEPAVAAALLNYKIVVDPITDRFSVRVEDKDSAAASEDPGALGIGRMGSVRGVLADVENRLASLAIALEKSRADFFALWTERDGFLEMPLTRLDDKAPANAVVRVPAKWLLEQNGSRPIASALYSASMQARAWVVPAQRPEFSAPVTVTATETDAGRANLRRLAGDEAVDVAGDVKNKIGLDSWREAEGLTPEQISRLRKLVLTPLLAAISRLKADSERSYLQLRTTVAHLSEVLNLVGCQLKLSAEQLACLDLRLERWAVRKELASPTDSSLAEAMEVLRRGFEADLQRQLYTVTLSEAGFLWFFGAWRWWELVWWTVFGVMTMGIFQIANHTLFGKAADGTRFDPRDGLRVLARLFYAPVLTVVFFWLALATDLVDAKTVFATNSFGALAVAFLLGLAPNHLMRLMLRTLEVVVRGGDKDKDAEKKAPPARRVDPLQGSEDIPRLDDLRSRLKTLATAPLE